MGIRAGSGKGIKPHKTPPKMPIKPTPLSPFPDKGEFRLGVYRIIEERDDYLICKGYDPNAKYPFSEITNSAQRTIKVAKPAALQQTIWENGPVVIDGVTYTYVYTAMGVRTVTWTDDDGDHEEEQTIEPPYGVTIDEEKELLVAVELRQKAVVDGIPLEDEDGGRLSWVDLNVSGRHWQGPGGAAESCSEVWEILIEGQATAGTFVLAVAIDPDGGGPDAPENITIDFDATSSEVKTALVTHTQIATGDIQVSGGPGPDVAWYVTFLQTGDLYRTQALPTPDSTGLVGPNPVVKVRKMTGEAWE